MQLHEVKEVKSVATSKAANDCLAEGWTLIAVVSDEKGARYVFGRGKAPNETGGVAMLMPKRLRRPSEQAEGSDD